MTGGRDGPADAEARASARASGIRRAELCWGGLSGQVEAPRARYSGPYASTERRAFLRRWCDLVREAEGRK